MKLRVRFISDGTDPTCHFDDFPLTNDQYLADTDYDTPGILYTIVELGDTNLTPDQVDYINGNKDIRSYRLLPE